MQRRISVAEVDSGSCSGYDSYCKVRFIPDSGACKRPRKILCGSSRLELGKVKKTASTVSCLAEEVASIFWTMMAVLSVMFWSIGCGSNDPNRTAQVELERNRKKLLEIQKSLSSARDESIALTRKIEKLSNEVSALQGSSNEKKP